MPANLEEEARSDATGRSPRRRLCRILWLLSGGALLAGALGVGAGLLVVQHYAEDLPSVAYLRQGYNPPQMSRILAADGTLLFTEFLQRRTVVPFSDVPDVTKLAFLAAGDAYFYEHGGINYRGLAPEPMAAVDRVLSSDTRSTGTRSLPAP